MKIRHITHNFFLEFHTKFIENILYLYYTFFKENNKIKSKKKPPKKRKKKIIYKVTNYWLTASKPFTDYTMKRTHHKSELWNFKEILAFFFFFLVFFLVEHKDKLLENMSLSTLGTVLKMTLPTTTIQYYRI